MKTNTLLAAAVLATAIGTPIGGFVEETKGQSMTSTGVRVPFLHGFPTDQNASQAEFASLARANEWLNSPPLTPSALLGKVVLIDFWTYTCINWRRTLPYVRAWADKYKDQGLVVIGVHAPEFTFEKNLDNVGEAGATFVSRGPVGVDARGIDVAADWSNLRSPENYVGVERTENFASPGGAALDMPRMYQQPARLSLNQWALSGDWTMKKEAAALNKAGGSIVYRFH